MNLRQASRLSLQDRARRLIFSKITYRGGRGLHEASRRNVHLLLIVFL